MEKGFKEFKVGDLVITPRAGGSKLDFRWKGPFRVAEKLGSTRYGVRICVQVSCISLMSLLFGCLSVLTMLILEGTKKMGERSGSHTWRFVISKSLRTS
jgi:hypothetical protein